MLIGSKLKATSNLIKRSHCSLCLYTPNTIITQNTNLGTNEHGDEPISFRKLLLCAKPPHSTECRLSWLYVFIILFLVLSHKQNYKTLHTSWPNPVYRLAIRASKERMPIYKFHTPCLLTYRSQLNSCTQILLYGYKFYCILIMKSLFIGQGSWSDSKGTRLLWWWQQPHSTKDQLLPSYRSKWVISHVAQTL